MAAKTFSLAERRLIARLRTPAHVQDFLRELPYNKEETKETLRSFRGVLRHKKVHCLEAALFAATVLEQHGHPPWVLDFESEDKLDHVVFLFRAKDGKWGTVGRSRDAGLHGRRPVFKTLRQLAWSYIDPYVDGSGRICGYAKVDLREITTADWRFSESNVWAVERALCEVPHRKIRASNRRHKAMLARYLAFRAHTPVGPFTDFPDRHTWL